MTAPDVLGPLAELLMSIFHAWPEDRLENVFIIQHARCVECKACFRTAPTWLTIDHPEGCPVRDLRAAQATRATVEQINDTLAGAPPAGRVGDGTENRSTPRESTASSSVAGGIPAAPTPACPVCASTDFEAYGKRCPDRRGEHEDLARRVEALERDVDILEEMREHIHWGTQEPKP